MHCFITSPSRKLGGQIFNQLHWIVPCLELPWDSFDNNRAGKPGGRWAQTENGNVAKWLGSCMRAVPNVA